MLFYEVTLKFDRNLRSTPFIQHIMQDDQRFNLAGIAEKVDYYFEDYAKKHHGYYLKAMLEELKASTLSFMCCYKYRSPKDIPVADYVAVAAESIFGCEGKVTAVRELSTKEFYCRNFDDYSNRSASYNCLQYDDKDVCFSYLDNEGKAYKEERYPEATKEAIYHELMGIMPHNTLKEEMERIFDKDYGVYFGMPTHYKIVVGSREAARRIVKLLVQALKCNHRILSTRTSYTCIDREYTIAPDELEYLVANNYGVPTVIELGEPISKSSRLRNDFHNLKEALLQAVREYSQNSLFIFVEIVGKQKQSHVVFRELEPYLNLVEIKEGVGTKEDAERLLRKLYDASAYTSYFDFDYVKQQCFTDKVAAYDISTVYNLWEDFLGTVLQDKLFPAYKHLVHVKLEQEEASAAASPYAKLKSMVGLSKVKETAQKIIAAFAVQRKREHLGLDKLSFSRHMLFTGNPGTAKTTVARLMAQIFALEGITNKATFVECGRADLIGEYVGQTAIKVKAKFREARGGVLFIDEAYSLVDGYRGYYGDEAINTIVQEMENNREDTIVIFAGYPKPMQRFLDANEGLRSRIGFHIDFPDYSAEELLQILELMLQEKSYTLSEDAKLKSLELFEQASHQVDAGNGRFVRNLLEQMIMQQSMRIYSDASDKKWDKDSISMLTAADVPNNLLSGKKSQAVKTIGFHC